MAMITPSLLAEFEARVERGEHINSTVHEEEQLLHAYRERAKSAEYAGQLKGLLERARDCLSVNSEVNYSDFIAEIDAALAKEPA